MKRIRNIIWSKDEPNIYDFWFKEGQLHHYKEGKWVPLREEDTPDTHEAISAIGQTLIGNKYNSVEDFSKANEDMNSLLSTIEDTYIKPESEMAELENKGLIEVLKGIVKSNKIQFAITENKANKEILDKIKDKYGSISVLINITVNEFGNVVPATLLYTGSQFSKYWIYLNTIGLQYWYQINSLGAISNYGNLSPIGYIHLGDITFDEDGIAGFTSVNYDKVPMSHYDLPGTIGVSISVNNKLINLKLEEVDIPGEIYYYKSPKLLIEESENDTKEYIEATITRHSDGIKAEFKRTVAE